MYIQTEGRLITDEWADHGLLHLLTVFDLIITHTPISVQSSNSVVFRLQPVYFFIKAYVVETHLNCIDRSVQFKWVPTTYAFLKKVRKSKTHKIITLASLDKSFSDLYLRVPLVQVDKFFTTFSQ